MTLLLLLIYTLIVVPYLVISVPAPSPLASPTIAGAAPASSSATVHYDHADAFNKAAIAAVPIGSTYFHVKNKEQIQEQDKKLDALERNINTADNQINRLNGVAADHAEMLRVLEASRGNRRKWMERLNGLDTEKGERLETLEGEFEKLKAKLSTAQQLAEFLRPAAKEAAIAG